MSRPVYHILVAEPDEVQRQLVDMLLSDTSYDLTLVGSGREALEHLKEHSPDLCLLALDLQDVPGDGICVKIRRVSRLARTPVVLLAEQAGRFGLSDDARKRARRSGADLVLPRPLGDKNLRGRIQSLLDARAETPTREGFSTRVIEDALDEIDGEPDGTTPDRSSGRARPVFGTQAAATLDTADGPRDGTGADPSELGPSGEAAAHVHDTSDASAGSRPHAGSRQAHAASHPDVDPVAPRPNVENGESLAKLRKELEILKVENAQLRRKLREKKEQLEQGVNPGLEHRIQDLERRNAALLHELEKLKNDKGGGLFGRRS